MGIDDVLNRLRRHCADGRKQAPSRTLPPLSITATALRDDKPRLAIAPCSRVITAMAPM